MEIQKQHRVASRKLLFIDHRSWDVQSEATNDLHFEGLNILVYLYMCANLHNNYLLVCYDLDIKYAPQMFMC
jgi:hypothetical protein